MNVVAGRACTQLTDEQYHPGHRRRRSRDSLLILTAYHYGVMHPWIRPCDGSQYSKKTSHRGTLCTVEANNTQDEYQSYYRKDKSPLGVFMKVTIEEPSAADSIQRDLPGTKSSGTANRQRIEMPSNMPT